MKLIILATKPLVHLATISFSVCLVLVSIPHFPTRVAAKPVTTNQRGSSPSRTFSAPNRGKPTSRVGGASRGGANNSEDDIQSSTDGTEVKPADPNVPTTSTVSTAPTDPTAQMLAKWGWTRIGCSPGAVFITGMGADTVCVNPTSGVAGGRYTYDRATNQLTPLNSSPENRQAPPENRQAPRDRLF